MLRRRLDASIQIVLTHTAERFMPPDTLATFSGGPVHTRLDRVRSTGQALHIELAEWAEHILVLPATAHTIHRLSHGAADDLLTAAVLSSAQPVTVAPAMHINMWHSRPVRRNVALLRDDGHHVLVGSACPPTHLASEAVTGTGLSPTPRLVLTHLLHLSESARSIAPDDGGQLHAG